MDLLAIIIVLLVVFMLLTAAGCTYGSTGYGGGGTYRYHLPPKNPIPPWYSDSIFGGVCLVCNQKIDWKMWDCVQLEAIEGHCGCTQATWCVDRATYKPVRKGLKNETLTT